jgi:ABC-type lipoprotein release transport system permease subunit
MRLRFLLQLACLFLYRSRKSTFILSFMVLTAVAALVFLSALAVGTNDAMIDNSTGLYSGHIVGSGLQPENIPLPSISGVEGVLIRKHLPVLLGKDGNFEPLTLIGVDAEAEKATTALWKKTLKGRYPNSGEPSIFIGQSTAERLDIAVGDPLLISNRDGVPMTSLIVAGIYRTGITHLDQGMAFCPVESLPGQAFYLSVAVFLAKGTLEDVVVASYRKFLPAASFVGWPEFMPDLKQLIDLDHICMGIVIVLVFAIVSVGISCAFHIFILKNLRDHGIMKAMGVLPSETALLLVAQILLLTLLAAALGTLFGTGISVIFSNIGIDIGAFTSHNQYFAVSGLLYPRLTLVAVLTPPSAAIAFGLFAAIWPTAYLLQQGPAEILRGA